MEIKNIVIEVENAFDGLIRRKIEEGTQEIFEVIMAENFSKLMTRQQITNPVRLEDTKYDK